MVNAENDDQVVSGFSVRKVRLFRNGDAYTRGKKVIVTPKIYKNFEQLLYNVSNDIKLVNGAVRKIYDLEGRAVLSLDDLQEGGSYIAAGNEPFRKVLYKLKEDEKNSSLSSLERLSGVKPRTRRKTRRIMFLPLLAAKSDGEYAPAENQLFGPTSKAFRVAVFTNGLPGIPPMRLVLNYRNCKSIDQVLGTISAAMERRIIKLIDLDGETPIKELQGIKDGMNIVAVGGEGFKKAAYPLINAAASQFDLRTEVDDTPHILTFFPNGDSYSHGHTFTLRRSRLKNFRKVLDLLNKSITLFTGRINKIYSIDGHRIESIDELLDRDLLDARLHSADPHHKAASPEPQLPQPTSRRRSFVVVSGEDAFINIEYNINRIKYKTMDSEQHFFIEDGKLKQGVQEQKVAKAVLRKSKNYKTSAKNSGVAKKPERPMKEQAQSNHQPKKSENTAKKTHPPISRQSTDDEIKEEAPAKKMHTPFSRQLTGHHASEIEEEALAMQTVHDNEDTLEDETPQHFN